MNKEVIEKAASERMPYSEEECGSSMYTLGKNVGFKRGFTQGAQWRINAVWHDASEKPKFNKTLKGEWFLFFFNHIFLTCSFVTKEEWQEYITTQRVIKWAYAADLMPDM